MQHLRIPDHLGVCEIGDRMVMLDLRRDRYLQLDRDSAAALRSWRDRDREKATAKGLSRLVERGMLIPASRHDSSGWPPLDRRMRSLPEHDSSGTGGAWTLVPEIAATLLSVRRRLKRQGIETAVRRLKHRRIMAASSHPACVAACFRKARQLVPLKPNCLTDSLSLAAILARRGLDCELVFGVKLDPFAAHCWLQGDGMILNDAADVIGGFTPIMVVRCAPGS